MRIFGVEFKFNGFDLWHSGNFDPASKATAAQGTKADAALPATSYTAADVLTKIKTVDGAGSGLDADLLDGLSSAAFALLGHKYHTFGVGQYFFDSIDQGNFLRIFIENSVYDTARFCTISTLEYYNGSAWVDWSSNLAQIQKLLDGREDTIVGGIDLTHRIFRFVLTKNTGWPTTTLIAIQNVWTNTTCPSMVIGVEDTTDSITWTSMDTCNFDGQFGTHLKVNTNLHNGRNINRITFTINPWVDTSAATIPFNRFMMLSNYQGTPLLPFTWGYTKVVDFKVTPTVNGAGLNADKLDGNEATAFAPSSHVGAGGTAHADASTTVDGFMIAADKVKLDGIAASANNYAHPANHSPSIITQDASNRFMTDAERTKLTGIATGATNYAHPANHPPAIITQDASNRFATDAEKTAWNAKAPLASPALTGTPTAPTPATAGNNTSIATTAFVKAQGYITSSGSGAKITVDPTAPTTPGPGDFWYDVL